MTGHVSLVGAGIGGPDLLTLQGARLLALADLVLFDALVPRETVALAARAQCFCVGKRAGRPSVSQEAIHRLMIRAARRGRRVVRLKAGDPFVLGRGGEEALALGAASVPFDVVPGVTSAVAAPSLMGIPVTHRGLATGFLVIAGHTEEALEAALPQGLPAAVTLVVLMGIRTRAALTSKLLARGMPETTPVAVGLALGTEDEDSWTGHLAELPAFVPSQRNAPGIIVIGDVVRLAQQLRPDQADADRSGERRCS
jgi:uroporphyrin-III C-methyltransferase/precorrin-2 dehydrogenase/sirohydrochlorin ferrochelatase